ncbi:hypothetical protein [Nodosilinea sp. P-1105]|uniref:hypothetical protein n=1 Tax=Nodosilinea sp. P-1105 TaxID=2546229 RepID=UPI00146E28FB|nr:hypothetical protein [Nodosilinea sp. P-1105]NMF84622.1 hypothetical protein [Nodosilinea sp. P-1105]
MSISAVCLKALVFSGVVAGAAIASPYPYPQVPRATAENQLRCFMHIPAGSSSLNLESLCGYVPTVVIPAGGAIGGGGSSGPCNSPDDRASDGSRCGGRAASVRPGVR